MKLKFFIITILLILSFGLYAQNVEIELDPRVPVQDEIFKIHFKIETKTDSNPEIEFIPRGIDILSKEETGVSTQTTYINGSLTVKKIIHITYEAIAKKTGTFYLDNIITKIDGKEVRSRSLQIFVSNVPMKAADVFLEAEASKNVAYVNESIVVRYYLYHKTQLASTDVKKFPDLPKFLKRFHQEPTTGERVVYKGESYTRRILYTAQLFAEKEGNYKIDPMSLDVTYSSGGSLGAFGFGYGQMRSTTISSKPVDITIIPLPKDNTPKSFTGLVSKHKYELRINKNQFLTNEPIEIELKIKGEGALEFVTAPKILQDPTLEEFEVNSDLSIKNDFTAEKTFSYTYLGRENLDLKDQKIKISYFDPASKTYKEDELILGDIKIIEGRKDVEVSKKKPNLDNKKMVSDEQHPTSDFYYIIKNTLVIERKILIAFLFSILLVLLWPQIRNLKIDKALFKFSKNEFSYRDIEELIFKAFGHGDSEKNISNSNLHRKNKEELLNILNQGSIEYVKANKNKNYKLSKSTLKNIEKIINEES